MRAKSTIFSWGRAFNSILRFQKLVSSPLLGDLKLKEELGCVPSSYVINAPDENT